MLQYLPAKIKEVFEKHPEFEKDGFATMWECLMQELSPSDDEMKVFLVEFGNLSQGSTLNPSIRLHGSLSVGSVSTELGLISLLPPLETMLKHKQHAFRLRWALSLKSLLLHDLPSNTRTLQPLPLHLLLLLIHPPIPPRSPAQKQK